jgi:hypothetical protein
MTLVEVVMATGILGIVAGAIIGTFNFGFFIMRAVRENQRATQILMEKVETIRLYSWNQVTNSGFIPSYFSDVYDPQAITQTGTGQTTTGYTGTGYTGSGSIGTGTRYYGLIQVVPVPFTNSYSANMKQVNVMLLWNSQGKTHIRRASTFVAKDGVQNYVY